MAGCLLLVVALTFSPTGSFNVVKAGALPPPELTVNPLVITETDSVTLNCVAPPSVSVSRCHFFIATQETSKNVCVETLTGTKLLEMTRKRSPAEVEVRCYIVQSDAIHSTTPDSKTSTIIINNLLPPKLTVNPRVITETDSVTLDCQIPSSVSVSECYFSISRKPAEKFSCLKTVNGTELLSLVQKSLSATVEVTCFYLISHQSPHSNMASVYIEPPPPELRVNPASVKETDSVAVNCVTPPSVSVSDCYLYSLSTNTSKVISCLQTLTGTELLSLVQKSPPATVEVTCFYLIPHQSPHSNVASVSIETPPPELRVNPASVTETDSVAVNCVTPPSVSVSDCYLYSLSTKSAKVISCLQTLTRTELLSMAHQSSPAEVEVTCFYTIGHYQSSHSHTSTIRIDVKSTKTQMTTFRTTTETASDGTDEATTDTLTSALPSVAPTDPSPVSEESNASTTDILKSDVPCVTQTNLFLELRMLAVAVSGFGVIVGVIIMGVTAVCHKRRSEKSFPERSQASSPGDFLSMTDIDRGGLLSADNTEAYISFVPAADRPTGSERVTGQESQSENVYHVYATIPQDAPAADLMGITYSTIQPH